MKSYSWWPSMIAGLTVLATLLLSTVAQATPLITDEDTFTVPELSLTHFAHESPVQDGTSMRTALTSLSLSHPGAVSVVASLLDQQRHTSQGFLGNAAVRKRRSRQQRRDDEEAFNQQYMGYAIMITGGALVVVGGIGLLAATKAPEGLAGSTALLGLGAIAGGGVLIYYGYQYKEEAAALSQRLPPAPLMVGYAGAF